MNEMNDPFVHVLKEISGRLKNEIGAGASKKSKKLNDCVAFGKKMLDYYNSWENSMDITRGSFKKMDHFKELVPYNDALHDAISDFNETINDGREIMGEAKRSWAKKCKKMYRELEISKSSNEKGSESFDNSAEVMAEGLKAISSIVRDNYKNMKTACIKVFTEYNTAVKAVPPKTRKKLSCKKIVITSAKLESFIGSIP